MDNESDFDFHALTRAQLEHAIETIDGSKCPKNLAEARTALADRISGASPAPVQGSDPAADARGLRVLEMILAVLISAFATLGIAYDDLWIPFGRGYGTVGVAHLHGTSAWVGALAIYVFASIPFLGGISEKADAIGILPKFRIVFWIGLILLALAFGMSWYGPLA